MFLPVFRICPNPASVILRGRLLVTSLPAKVTFPDTTFLKPEIAWINSFVRYHRFQQCLKLHLPASKSTDFTACKPLDSLTTKSLTCKITSPVSAGFFSTLKFT